MASGDSATTTSQREIIRTIRADSAQGRAVVPLLGAGVSIEAGYPPLAAISRYLAKCQAYFDHELYRQLTDVRWKKGEKSRSSTDYLRDFGWPDLNQLESDLWFWLEKPEQAQRYGDEVRSRMDFLVQEQILKNLSLLDHSLIRKLEQLQDIAQGRDTTFRAFARLLERIKDQERRPELLRKHPWGMNGDYWMRLLNSLTRADPDFIDQLFQRLGRRRQPGTAHRYLAFLTPILRMRIFLTTNFDNLLEEALRFEGLQPVVYDVGERSLLPHPSLVHQEISVLKLHGGAFGLRVGDSLDSPLDEESKKRLREYLGSHPHLLVMGLGGWDQRVLDMVDLVIENGGRISWLRFENELKGPARRLQKETQQFQEAQVRDPGAFLKELFAACTHTHPASLRPYSAYKHRPVPERRESDNGARGSEHPIRFFLESGDDGAQSWASLRLASSVAEASSSHLPIWIDLESKSTVEEIVVDLVSQLRRYDPSLPPEILAIERSAERRDGSFTKTVRRIYSALRRGRYIVAFDGVGSLGRSPTQHHGYLDSPGETQNQRASQFLFEMFLAAHRQDEIEWKHSDMEVDEFDLRGELKDSILAFGVDCCRKRDKKGSRALSPFFWEWMKKIESSKLVSEGELPQRNSLLAGRVEPVSGFQGQDRYAWLLICACRRRRSFVALRSLLPKYLKFAAGSPPREGLRAVRRGLDILLPEQRDEKALKKNFALQRLLRLWLMLMVCGAYLTRLFDQRDIKELWEAWTILNELEGIVKLPYAPQPKTWLVEERQWSRLPNNTKEENAQDVPGLQARHQAQTLVEEALNSDLLFEDLINRLTISASAQPRVLLSLP